MIVTLLTAQSRLKDPRSNGEYICVVDRVGADARDEMTVMVEVADNSVNRAELQLALERRLHEALAVKVVLTIADKGGLDELTGTSQTTKPKRLLDKRKG